MRYGGLMSIVSLVLVVIVGVWAVTYILKRVPGSLPS